MEKLFLQELLGDAWAQLAHSKNAAYKNIS